VEASVRTIIPIKRTDNTDARIKENNFFLRPDKNLETEIFYAGKATPVLHYCIGGITMDKEGNVLREEKIIISGFHAAGGVAGGVHGVNRLGGNSLLECTVYGTIVGQKIPVSIFRRHQAGFGTKHLKNDIR
jgi:succinate dehydrogenase/fumarate reductase flavoprotein subunit